MILRGWLAGLDAPAGARRLFAGLLIIFVAMLLPTGDLGSNEEHYFQRAHRYVEPAAFPDDSAVFGDSVTRIAGDVLIGYPVAWLGYENAAAVLRVANALMYAAGFALFAAAWSLSLVDAALALAAFWLLGQQLYGGEWMFGDVEGKTFAYALVLLGLGLGFRRKWGSADACFVAATWMHLLAGGFWLVFALGYRLLAGDRPRALVPQVARYAAGVLPLVVAIGIEQSASAPSGAGYDAAYIYSMLRNAHHVAPFADVYTFWTWTPGIVSGVGLLAALVYAGRTSDRALRALLLATAGVLAFLLLALAASWLDRETGALGKFFLFRPSSLALLIALVGLAAWSRRALGAPLGSVRVVVALWVLPVFAWVVVQDRAARIAGDGERRAELREVVAAVRARTEPDDLVLLQPGRDGEPPEVALPRLLGRPTYVSWKFVPTAPEDLVLWHERMQRRARFFESACAERGELAPALLLGWTDAWDPRLEACGPVVWRSAHYWLIAPQ